MSAPVLATDLGWSELRDRLIRASRGVALTDGWDLGVAPGWLAGLLEAWSAFDRAGAQARVDALDHRFLSVGAQPLHVCLVPGRGRRPLPLLLTNGWPSSFLEYLEIIPLLTSAERDPGSGHDCFSLVIPSLPGFGFSGAPTGALAGGAQGSREVAGLWHRLMTEELSHAAYVAHGSDLGAGITAWLGRDHAGACVGIHLASPHLPAPRDPIDPEQAAFATALRRWNAAEGAYAHLHSTKPLTLGSALLDSPAGLAAWIGEKFLAWSTRDEVGTPFGSGSGVVEELLLATLTLYWSTETIATSMLPYWAFSRGDNALGIDAPSPVPTSVDIFGGETVPFPQPPRSLAERYFTVTGWTEHASGGHFPAASVPDALAGALRRAFGLVASG